MGTRGVRRILHLLCSTAPRERRKHDQSYSPSSKTPTTCDLCRVHWWCDFGPHGLPICLHCRAAAVTNTCAIADDNVYVAAMSSVLLRPPDNTDPSKDGAITASLGGGASNGQHDNGTFTANASSNIIDYANTGWQPRSQEGDKQRGTREQQQQRQQCAHEHHSRQSCHGCRDAPACTG